MGNVSRLHSTLGSLPLAVLRDHSCIGVPHATPRLHDSLEGLIGISLGLYSQLWFLTAAGHKVQSTKEKASGPKSGGNQRQAPSSPLPVEPHRTRVSPPAMRTTCVKCCQPGELSLSLGAQAFMGDGHVGTLSLVHIKIPDSRRKASVQHQPHCLHKHLRQQWATLLSSGSGESPPKIQVPRHQQAFLRMVTQACDVITVLSFGSDFFSSFPSVFLTFHLIFYYFNKMIWFNTLSFLHENTSMVLR